MIARARVVVTECWDPYRNLAMEDALLTGLPADEAILFLWQNRHTVVIGAGQNAWQECNTQLLEAEGGTLARRASGGGAVYHDLGNLNFSFLVPRADYDVARQLSVISNAVRALGVRAETTGRNDVTVGGRKFSGNAFRLLDASALHHGTLMVSVDMDRLTRYLTVDPEKLKAKGVKSVRARVANLSEFAPVTVESLRGAMIGAFSELYGPVRIADADEAVPEGFEESYARHRSWEWNYGRSPRGSLRLTKRFDWGSVTLTGEIVSGALADVRVFTDAMDETLAPRLEAALGGCAWQSGALAAAVRALGIPDLESWLSKV
ncbi:MAG: lipoate--protein ligase [Clostridia bacterium]|nr:lipoate--protein ligase [Clostridia bacterium]